MPPVPHSRRNDARSFINKWLGATILKEHQGHILRYRVVNIIDARHFIDPVSKKRQTVAMATLSDERGQESQIPVFDLNKALHAGRIEVHKHGKAVLR